MRQWHSLIRGTKIEVLDETPNTPNGTDGLNSELEASSAVANYFGK